MPVIRKHPTKISQWVNTLNAALLVILSTIPLIEGVDLKYVQIGIVGAAIVTTFLSYMSVRLERPYWVTIQETDWLQDDDGYRFEISSKEHRKGRYPVFDVYMRGDDGTFEQVFADQRRTIDGTLVVSVGRRIQVDVEVRYF